LKRITRNQSSIMPTLKDITIEILKNISPSASLEEIMYKINLAAQVMEGIKDAEQGKVISTDELLKRMDSWAK
jgi:predicted transcriptional regulator